MKCKNCGVNMAEMVSTKGPPVIIYVCPYAKLIIENQRGIIYCDRKVERKKK